MPCFCWADGKGSHPFSGKNIAFLPKLWLFKISSGRKEKQLQFHSSGCEASVGTQALEVMDSQHAIQGHSWIQFSPTTAIKLHLSQRKAFSLKQRVKFLLVEKQFLSPLSLKSDLVGVFFVVALFFGAFFFLPKQKFQIFSKRCRFYFSIICKTKAVSANTNRYSSWYCYVRTWGIPVKIKVTHFRGLDSGLKIMNLI